MPSLKPARPSGRSTNLALLFLVPIAVGTGLLANSIGVEWLVPAAVFHGLAAVAIAVLTPWKSMIIRRGAARRRPSRWTSYGLSTLVLITLLSGLVHATGLTHSIGPLTIMQIHVGGGVLSLVMVIAHYRAHPLKPRTTDLDRRSMLRAVGLTGLTVFFWAGWEAALRATGLPGGERRYTGSHERGSYQPSQMPVTSWLNDRVQHLDTEEWLLRVDGEEIGMDELADFESEEVTAILDCTSGWFSEQIWKGIPLTKLVDAGGKRSIVVKSASGYARRFPADQLDRLWLATHVGDEPLSDEHGAPARIVAPDRRGFWWVKWVVEMETSDVPWWLQLPFPAT